MSFVFKDSISLNIFGSSHGELVGCTLGGIPSGAKIDHAMISKWMERRAPGRSTLTSQRKESDEVKIVSGVVDGYTDGGAITMLISNHDIISKHYDELMDNPRPGHGDISLFIKYGEHRNFSGGGFLSGRMTAPLVAAGSIALGILNERGIEVSSCLEQMGDIRCPIDGYTSDNDVYSHETRMPHKDCDLRASEMLKKLSSEGDSTGGIIGTHVMNAPPGIGEPFFDSVESVLSHLVFSIPGVKGIEFGSGFAMSSMKGSETNDPLEWKDGRFISSRNNNGGILGGIAYGNPIYFRTAMKPTSSIRIEQDTVNVKTHENSKIVVKGRHDPCIAIRAVPVVNCVTAIGILDLYLRSGKFRSRGLPAHIR